MRLAFLLTPALATFGCQAGITPDPADGSGPSSSGGTSGAEQHQGFEQGSRLKVKALVGADGSEQRVGFWDSQRNEDCVYQHAADGTARCMPIAATTANGLFYSDQACSVPLAMGACATPTNEYASLAAADACGGPPVVHIYQRGIQVTGQVYEKAGQCIGVMPSSPVFALGDEIDPSVFVEAQEMLVP